MMEQHLSSPEQQKVTALLNKYGVDYLAAGDFAMRKYVDTKYFDHLKIWVKPTAENHQKLEEAFASVRRKFPVDQQTFLRENAQSPLHTIGRGHKGVEIFNSLSGLSTEEFSRAYASRKQLNAANVPVPVLHEKDLHRSLQQSPKHTVDLSLLERAMPSLSAQKTAKPLSTLDWRECARSIDAHKMMTDLGFEHNPKKGRLGTSHSQVYQRGEETVVVYPNPKSKPFFLDQTFGKKGDALDMLNWQYNYDRKQVNQYLKEHFNGSAPRLIGGASLKTETREPQPKQVTTPVIEREVAERQRAELKEKYAVRETLDKPGFLQSRGLSLSTIFRPEFFKQVSSALGWSNKEQKTINVDNTVFPLRNDQGVISMIIRNQNFKGAAQAERQDAVWLSNPPLTLGKDITIGKNNERITLPKGTEGTLIHQAERPGHYQFYYQDPHKSGALNYNKIEVSGKALTELTKALNPLRVDRMIVTENPMDAMSFHQVSPPKSGETRMYVSTGGQPSEKQQSYINQLVQRIQPAQVVMANDNDKHGTRFNINEMGAIQHPSVPVQHQFLARLQSVAVPGGGISAAANAERPSPPPLGEYHITLMGPQSAQKMEKLATALSNALNRFTPKGEEPPARILHLNGAQGSAEATVAFPQNDRLLQRAQKQLEKMWNEHAPEGQPVIKVVKPIQKDFNEDLQQSQQQNSKIDYSLGKVPTGARPSASSLLEQVTGLGNNAFDALFGGVPGSLPRLEKAIESSQKQVNETSPRQAPENASRQAMPDKPGLSENSPVNQKVESSIVSSSEPPASKYYAPATYTDEDVWKIRQQEVKDHTYSFDPWEEINQFLSQHPKINQEYQKIVQQNQAQGRSTDSWSANYIIEHLDQDPTLKSKFSNQQDTEKFNEQKEQLLTKEWNNKVGANELVDHYLDNRKQGQDPSESFRSTLNLVASKYNLDYETGMEYLSFVRGKDITEARHVAPEHNESSVKKQLTDILRIQHHEEAGNSLQSTIKLIEDKGINKLPKADKDDAIRVDSVLSEVRMLQGTTKSQAVADLVKQTQDMLAQREAVKLDQKSQSQASKPVDAEPRVSPTQAQSPVQVLVNHQQAVSLLTAVTHLINTDSGKSVRVNHAETSTLQDFQGKLMHGLLGAAHNPLQEKLKVSLNPQQANTLGKALDRLLTDRAEQVLPNPQAIREVTTFMRTLNKSQLQVSQSHQQTSNKQAESQQDAGLKAGSALDRRPLQSQVATADADRPAKVKMKL